MFFRRVTISSLCVLTAAGMVLAADNRNPFAEWDRLKQKTGITESRSLDRNAQSGGASLEYFSPNAKPQEATEESDEAQPVERKRLRLMGAPVDAAKSQVPASASKANWPSSFTVLGNTKKPAAKQPTIIQAAAEFTEEEQQKPQIQQVAAEVREVPQLEEPNPFAGFINVEQELAVEPEATEPTQAASAEVLPGTGTPVVPSPSVPDVDISSESSGPQNPAVTLQWVQHGDFNVGQECRCDLLIENSGRHAVRNVIAEAVIPAGLQVLDSNPSPMSTGGSASWTFGELQPGEIRKVELTVVPQGRGDLRMNAFVRFTGFSTSLFSVQEPLLAVKVSGSELMEVGQQAGYVVEVTNPGTGVARNVRIQAAIPEGLEHRRGSLLTIEIGTLNPGESRQARLSLTALHGGAQSLAVRSIADGGLSDETMTVVTVAEPQLNIALAGPENRLAGQAADYELTVINEGQVLSNNVRAKYRVPEGYEFVRADRGGKYTQNDQTIDWFVGTLEPGQSSSFHVTLKPIAPGAGVHKAGVISEHGKITMADHSTTVEGNAELDLEVVAQQKQLAVGEEAIFEVRIKNTGSRSATSVGLSCELPAGLELIDAAGPSEYIAENGVMVFRSLPSLESGKTAVFAIKARCSREGAHRLRVRAASESITEPLIGEESAIAVSR